MHIPTTVDRVRNHTPQGINEKIDRASQRRVLYYARHPEKISMRLDELDREWDIERVLETNAASVSIAGVILGALVDKKWFMLPLAVGGFLLQHSISGWCPPLPVLRRLGVRTQSEIEQERYALKALRGDFHDIDGDGTNAPSKRGSRVGRILRAVK